MNLDKLAISIYDFLGYLLPGYVVLIVCSLVESTFVGSWYLSLSVLTRNAVVFAAVSYFLGHIAQGIASTLTKSKRFRTLIQAPFDRLADPIAGAVRDELNAAYGDRIDAKSRDNLDTYLLADAYILAAGGNVEREMLIAREGFFKQSVAALALMTFTLGVAAVRGGLQIQTAPGSIHAVAFWPTILLTVASLAVTLLFRLRFGFYHRVKINNTLRLFLALRVRNVARHERRR
jgi:hypothetical protein